MITLRSYIHHDSPVHRRDPRVKIIAVTLFSILILHGNNLVLLLATVITLGASQLARIPCPALLRALRPVLPFFVGLFVLYALFTPGHPLLFHVQGVWQADFDGVWFGVFQVARFLLLVWMAAVLTMTSSLSDMTAGLERLLRPLRHFGISSANAALMVSLALRFIPTLMDEMASIREAQLARGADPNPRSLVKKVRFMTGLAVPLATNILRRSDQLVDAMEARGFQPGPRSHLRELALDTSDILVLMVTVGVFAATWFYV